MQSMCTGKKYYHSSGIAKVHRIYCEVHSKKKEGEVLENKALKNV